MQDSHPCNRGDKSLVNEKFGLGPEVTITEDTISEASKGALAGLIWC